MEKNLFVNVITLKKCLNKRYYHNQIKNEFFLAQVTKVPIRFQVILLKILYY